MPIRAQIRPGARARVLTAAVAAVVAALALPALAGAAANPVTFNYSNSTAITAYAKPTGAVVVGRNFFNPALVDRIQAGGGEVYQYVDVIDGWWTSYTATGDQAALYGGSQQNPAWLWSPRRSNWPGTYMTDMRPGSPWILHAVEHIKRWFPTTHAKGLFLDVVGERLWTSSWNAMSASEKSAWAAGNRDFVHRLRVALGPKVILIANNSWENGNPELNGVTVEHHPYSSATFWSKQLGRSDWFTPVRNIVIANSTSEAGRWAAVPGVTHVSAQSSYGGPAAPVLPFSQLPTLAPNELAPSPATPGPVTTPAPDPSVVLPAPSNPPRRGPAMMPKPSPGPTSPAPTPIVPRRNLLGNASLESSVAPWSTWHGTVRRSPADDAPDGRHVARVRFDGVGTAYSLGHLGRRVAATRAGVALRAQAYVRAGSSRAVGKPLAIYVRETTPSGRLVQRVRGSIVRLGAEFAPLRATLTPRSRHNSVDVLLVQRRAAPGDVFLADALGLTRGS
jgi:hypothetical protein